MTIKFLEPRPVFYICLLAATLALGSALVAQFGFGLKPCILCLYARIPYAAAMVLCVVALLRPAGDHKLFLTLIMIAFFAAFAIAFFHVGVEQHWWELSGGCPVEKLNAKTSADALAELLATPLAPCDKVAWKLFDISIVIWNAVFSLAVHDYVMLAFALQFRKPRT